MIGKSWSATAFRRCLWNPAAVKKSSKNSPNNSKTPTTNSSRAAPAIPQRCSAVSPSSKTGKACEKTFSTP